MNVLVIAGSRLKDATDEQKAQAYTYIHDHLQHYNPLEWMVITGGADGVDTCAHLEAVAQGFKAFRINAEWTVHGRYNAHAGFERNTCLVTVADAVYVVWDGVSGGTLDTMKKAQKKGILVDCDYV